MKKKLRRYIGDRHFYKMLLAIVVPIIIQNGITNFVSLLDNLMVGRIGTEQMSGVAIVNQLIFVFNLCIFGAVSGAGIFTAQFFGHGDYEGVRNTFRFKFLISIAFSVIGIAAFVSAGSQLVSLFLHEGGESGDIMQTLKYGEQYLGWILIGLLPFALSQVYSGTLRETGETIVPMVAGVAAVFVNLIFNYLLIYGSFGFPKLGVEGAAIATVLSRYVELGIITVWSHTHTDKVPYIKGVYRTLKIPKELTQQIVAKGLPLILNEALWAFGIAILNQCYSTRGLAAVAGINISSTITNLFNVVFIAMGSALAIIVGQLLGAGKLNEVKELATFFIIFSAFMMPFNAFLHSAYFTLRSGGKTLITFFFDAGFVWIVSIPLAMMLSRLTDMPVRVLYACCTGADLIKVVIGYILVKRGKWVVKIVDND